MHSDAADLCRLEETDSGRKCATARSPSLSSDRGADVTAKARSKPTFSRYESPRMNGDHLNGLIQVLNAFNARFPRALTTRAQSIAKNIAMACDTRAY